LFTASPLGTVAIDIAPRVRNSAAPVLLTQEEEVISILNGAER
jgi:hypothetical protein